MAVRAALASATCRGGNAPGLADSSSGGAGMRAHQSPLRSSSGASMQTASSHGSDWLAGGPASAGHGAA
eukprot:12909766-Alexandrium_andersonii.AAC.1